jgi:hypothetical protein
MVWLTLVTPCRDCSFVVGPAVEVDDSALFDLLDGGEMVMDDDEEDQ